jgi:hypothetical protein
MTASKEERERERERQKCLKVLVARKSTSLLLAAKWKANQKKRNETEKGVKVVHWPLL